MERHRPLSVQDVSTFLSALCGIARHFNGIDPQQQTMVYQCLSFNYKGEAWAYKKANGTLICESTATLISA